MWSSFAESLKPAAQRVAWRRVDRWLGEMRIPQDSEAGRSQLEQNLEQRRAEERGADWKNLRRGWYLGDEAFGQELLAQISERGGDWHYGAELMESAEAKAQRLIAVELQRQGWTGAELQTHRKGSEFKVRLASKLRAETTLTLGWIAKRLHMGTRGYLTHLLYRHDQTAPRDSNQGRLWA